jgi:hypothetical protein
MTDSSCLAFPLNETALQAAGQKIVKKIHWLVDEEGERRGNELARAAVSTYLREAGFEVQKRGGFGRGPEGLFVEADSEQRLIGQWGPIDTTGGEHRDATFTPFPTDDEILTALAAQASSNPSGASAVDVADQFGWVPSISMALVRLTVAGKLRETSPGNYLPVDTVEKED